MAAASQISVKCPGAECTRIHGSWYDIRVAEVVAAFDGYRARWLAPLSPQRPLRPVIVTNGESTRQTQRAATEYGVQVITAKQLWSLLAAARCTRYDVVELENRRLASMRELPEALRRTLSI